MAKDIPNPDDYFGPSSSKAGKPAPNPDDYFGPVQSAAPAKPEAPGVLDRARDAIVQAATSVVPSAQQLSDARDTTANMAAGAVRAGMQLFGQAKPEEPKTVMGVDSTAKAGGPTATVPAQDGGAPYDQNLFASIKRGIESGDIDPNDPRLSPVGRRLAQRIASQSGISGPVHDATGQDDRLKRMQDHMPAGQGTPPRDTMQASEPKSLLSRVLDKTVRKPMDNSLAGAALETAGDAVRGSVRGLNAVEQGLWGGVQAASDIAFGGDSAASRLASASARAASANMDEIASQDRNSTTQQIFESVFMNIPVLLGFGTGSKALAAMSSLSGGQAYHEAKNAGMSTDAALERGIWTAISEAIGEKLSLPTLGKMFSQAAAKASNKELGHVLADLLVKDQAGEQLTQAMESAYDKFGRGGTRHNMTVGEYLDDVVNTAKVTLGQSLLMGGAAHVVRAAMPASAAAPGLVARNYDKLFGDSPATSEDAHRVQVLGVVDRLAKQHGLAPDALAAIKEQSANVPAADLAAWTDRAMLAMAKRGMMQRPGDWLSAAQSAEQAEQSRDQALSEWGALAAASRAQQPTAEVGQPSSAGRPTDSRDTSSTPAQQIPDSAGDVLNGEIDVQAHQAATSPANDLPEPTQAQKEAGNYKKGHISIQGLDIAVENPRGSTRSGVDADGTPWETTMQHHYGYIKGTVGNDKDRVDTFIGQNPQSGKAFVIDQIDPKTGEFDEHKVVLGADSIEQAREIYQSNYAPDWRGLGAITELPMPAFKSWVHDGAKKSPLGDISKPQAGATDGASATDAGTAGGRERLGNDAEGGMAVSGIPGRTSGELPATPAPGDRQPEAAAVPERPTGPDAALKDLRAALADLADVMGEIKASNEAEQANQATQPQGANAAGGSQAEQGTQGTDGVPAERSGSNQKEPADLIKKVFAKRRDAEKARDELGNEYRLQKVAGGYKLRPFTDREREAAYLAGERLRGGAVNVETDPLLVAISKLGGIAMSERADTITEGNRNVAGRMLFRKKGLQLDMLAQRLDEVGYIPPDEYESDGGVTWLRDAIGEEFAGRRQHFSMSGDQWMRQRQQQALGDAPDYDAHGITHSEIEASGYLDEDEETQRAIDAIVDAMLELQDQREAKAEEDFWHSLSQIEQEEEDHAKQEAERGAADSEAGLRDRGTEVAPTGKESASDRGGQEAGRGVEQDQGSEQSLTLQAQTEQDLRDRAEREAAATKEERRAKKAEQDRLDRAQQSKEHRHRADATVDDFQLGQTADQQLSGMGDLFADDGGKLGGASDNTQGPRRGKVGDKLEAGEVVLTSSGRKTTPFPKISFDTNRKATNTLKAVDTWLMSNALDEAESRGDSFNAGWLRQSQQKPSQADKDAAEEYLFGQQPAVLPSALKPLTQGTKDQTNPPEKKSRSKSLRVSQEDSDEVRQAKADAMKALGDLADILGSSTKKFMLPEQEQKLLPVLTRLFDAAFRLGYLKFKEAARFALDQVRNALGDEAADMITLEHLQGGYIGMSGRYKDKGADGIKEVSQVASLDEINQNAPQENDRAPSTDPDLERDRRNATPEASGVGQAVRHEGRGDDRGAEPDRGRPVAAGDRQQNHPGMEADGSAAAGERSDQPVRDDGPPPGLALDPTRADDGERSGDLGFERVPPDTIPASALVEVATTIPEDAAKRNAQRAADQVAIKAADLANIKATLPYLMDGQHEDVFKAEKRFAKPDGYGILFTNGTGTGKTFTGLGIAKRFARQGKTGTLIVAPDAKVLSDWIESGRALGLTITQLKGTQDAGNGIVITTYANLGANDALAKRKWDLVIADEAHKLSQEKDGTHTSYLKNLRAITLHPDGLTQRFTMLNRPAIEELAELSKSIDSKRKLADADDTMDVMRAALLKEVEKLGALYIKASGKLDEKRQQNREEVLGSQGAARTRVAMLSATPFAYEQSIDLAEGYLFGFDEGMPEDGASGTGSRPYNSGSNRDRFFMQHFGYRMRHNRLTRPDAEVDSGLMQRQFNTWLKSRGVLSARTLDVPFDYDRRFILVESAIGNRIDEALEWISDKAQAFREAQRGNESRASNGYDVLSSCVSEKFDYQSRRYLLEAIKASEVIRHVREHMKLGRKVVVFHDYKKGGGFNPFNVPSSYNPQTAEGLPDPAAAEAYKSAAAEFRAEFKDLVESNLGKMQSPIEVFSKEFPDVLLINGDQKKADLLERYKRFNDDATGPMVALVQSAKNAGWSGHDTTGKHQRVLFNLGQPTAPTMAIQQEGRIYRTGQASNAIFRYLNTGTNWERWAFASTIAMRASTAENLGMGEQARNLKDAFISAFEESGDFPAGHEGEGTGGKERDKAQNAVLTDFERAKTFYFGTQKKDSRTKAQEGKDYFATPEPLGQKMVEWSDVRGGESGLEPSGGHGAIARWMPENVNRVAIEPSAALRSRLALVFDGKILGEQFEDHNIVNKYDVITMNPPFGVGGKTAIDHLSKAAGHLNDGGRIVAIIPTGPAADKRFEKWFYGEESRQAKPLGETVRVGKFYTGDVVELDGRDGKYRIEGRNDDGLLMLRRIDGNGGIPEGHRSHYLSRLVEAGPRTEQFKPAAGLHLVADIALPSVAFERAGTNVMTRVVIIDKGQAPQGPTSRIDLTSADTIKDLFDRIEHLSVAKRVKISQPAEEAAQTRQSTARAEKEAAAKQGAELASSSGMDLVEHTTGRGKVIKGVIRTDLTREQAKSIDDFTFKKDGGWFIRDKHIAALQEKFPVTGGVAQEPPATYHAGTYETDLFGHPVPAAARARRAAAAVEPAANRDVQRAGELRDTAAPAGDYIVRTTVGSTEQRKLGASIVKTASQAAAATQYLYKSPVERFDAIVTDAQHKPLAVVGGFKGAISQTSVYPATVVAEAIRIDGAAHIWLSHNHPSGIADLSRADINLWDVIRDVLRGSGIEPMGLIAVGNGRFGYVERDGSQGALTMDRDGAHGSATVPVVERELLSPDIDRQVVDSPAVSKQLAHDFYQQSRSPGMILLDAQLRVSAWVPLPKNTLGALRDTGGMNALYRAVSEANAASVILVHGGELDERGNLPGHITVGQNIGAALNKLDVRVVDSINAGSKPIKSAAERGDDLHAGPVFSLKPGAWYRSELQTQVEKSPMNAGQPGAWRQYLDALSKRGAVKADEIEWTGLREWLELQPGKVTKGQILDYLDSNGVQVSEEVLGGEPNHVYQDTGEEFPTSQTENPPKYGSYTLPGGENYRELVLTLPTKKSLPDGFTLKQITSGPHRGGWGVYGPGPLPENMYGSGATQEEAIASFGGHGHNGKVFKSRHWDQPNVLAHIRFNERTDADGKRVLFIEEIQSDWGQTGKRIGFRDEGKIREAKAKADALRGEWEAANRDLDAAKLEVQKHAKAALAEMGLESYQQIIAAGPKRAELTARYKAFQQEPAYAKAIAEKDRLDALAGDLAVRMGEYERGHGQDNTVPLAPFVTKTEAWVALALKRAISWAASNGFDRVALVTGEQSAERYDLSKRIESIEYRQRTDGPKSGTGLLTAYDHSGNQVVYKPNVEPADLPSIIGKEVADRLMNSPGPGYHESTDKAFALSGEDLKVGGEGMRAFYDKIVPSVAKDVLKKLGGEAIKKISIGEGGAYSKHVGLEDGKAVHVFDSRSSAQRWAENGANRTIKPEGQIEQPGFDITDKMRAHAEAGMPLFARNKAGASSTDGKASSIAAAGSGVDQPASAISRKDLDEVIARVSVGWAGFARSKVTVAPTALDLPRPIVDFLLAEKAPLNGIEGVEHDGRVYLVQANIRSAVQAETVLFHEVYGHMGMRLLGAKMHSTLNAIWSDIGGFEGVAKIAKRQKFDDGSTVWDRLQPYIKMSSKMPAMERRSMIVDELIAFIAQRNDTSALTRFKTYLADLKTSVVNFLYSKGFDRLAAKLDSAGREMDVLALVRDARNAVTTGKMKDGSTIRAVRNAGSPSPSILENQAETPEFKKWFGDSKVVDDYGNPLVVYHGSPDARFVEQDGIFKNLNERYGQSGGTRAFWFAKDRSVAATYADDRRAFDYQNAESGIVSAYLRLQNPLIVEAGGKSWREAQALGKTSDVIEQARSQGRDGVIIRDVRDNYSSLDKKAGRDQATDTYVVFASNQIKSATNNAGTFDVSIPDIRLSMKAEAATAEVKQAADKGYREKVRRILARTDGVVNGLGKLPDQDQYLAQRYRTLGKIARVDAIAGEIRKAFRTASAEDKRSVYDYLTTAGADTDGIAGVELRDMAMRVKRYIGTVGDELVKRGLLGEEAREEYRDRYLPRMYLAHLLDENDWRAIGAGKKVSDMGYLKQRKEIPEEVRRIILGEVTDPSFLAASAIAKPMRDMALLDWLSQISQNEKWVWPESLVESGGGKASAFWLKAEAEALRKRARHYADQADRDAALKIADQLDAEASEKIDGLPLNHKEYKQIPNTPRYGRLRGMLVRSEIYDDLMGAQDFLPKDPGWAQQILSFGGYGTKATQLWKMSKVSLNVPGQIRNMISNLVMLQLSGVPLHRFPVVLSRSIRNIRADGKYWQIAKKYGVTESTFQAHELFRAKRDLLQLERDMRGMTPWLAIKTAAAAITDLAGDAYQASESFVKTAKILHAMEYEGMTEEAAALEAQKWLFDYSLVNRNTRYLRNSPIGMPFVTYQTKVAPRLMEVAALHPWRFLPWVALMYGMQAWAMSAFGGDDDEWKKLKKALPQWMQDKNHIAFLPWRDENGRLQAVDMSYFFPWSQWTEFGGDMAEGELGKAMQAAGLFGGPVTDLIVALETNKDSFTKRDIYAAGDPVEKQAAAVLAYVYDMAVPPMISSRGVASPLWLLDSQYGGKLADAMTGRTNRIGAEKSTVGQAAAAAVGINAYGIDPEQSRTMNLLQLKNEVDQTKARARSALSNRGLSSIKQKEVAKQYTDELVRRTKKFSDYANESKVPEFAKRRQPADAP